MLLALPAQLLNTVTCPPASDPTTRAHSSAPHPALVLVAADLRLLARIFIVAFLVVFYSL